MPEKAPKYLEDLVTIARNPQLKEYLDQLRVERVKQLFNFFSGRLPDPGSAIPFALEDGDGVCHWVGLRIREESIYSSGVNLCTFTLSNSRIVGVEDTRLERDDSAVTASLRFLQPYYEDSVESYYRLGPLNPLFTVTHEGHLFGPVSDLATIESFLSDTTREPIEVTA